MMKKQTNAAKKAALSKGHSNPILDDGVKAGIQHLEEACASDLFDLDISYTNNVLSQIETLQRRIQENWLKVQHEILETEMALKTLRQDDKRSSSKG